MSQMQCDGRIKCCYSDASQELLLHQYISFNYDKSMCLDTCTNLFLAFLNIQLLTNVVATPVKTKACSLTRWDPAGNATQTLYVSVSSDSHRSS